MANSVILKINKEKLPLNNYIELLFEKLNLALISTLKGIDEKNLKDIEILIKLTEWGSLDKFYI